MSRHLSVLGAATGLVLALTSCAGATRGPTGPSVPSRPSGAPRNGLEVIGHMRYEYPSRALHSMVFTVDVTDFRGGSPRTRKARGYAALPGKLRVEFLPTTARAGSVRDRRQLAVFQNGRRVALADRVDLVALLGYDIYAQAIDTTVLWLDRARVRFGAIRRDELDGRDVWVVGAERGDTTTTQFWVDAHRWHVVRIIQRDPRSGALQDIRFADFVALHDVPVPCRIEFYERGRLREQHVMANHVANAVIPRRSFDLNRWR